MSTKYGPLADVQVVTNTGAPSDGTSGTGAGVASPGAILIDVTNANVYINSNTKASPTWSVLSGLGLTISATELGYIDDLTPGTQEADKAVVPNDDVNTGVAKLTELHIGSTGAEVEVTATPAELNQLDGNILADMTPGTGISTGTGTICEHRVTKIGGLFKTEILLDITGLNEAGTAADVVGKDGAAANCHLGQITAAVNGTIKAGRITCIEAPGTAHGDLDFYGTITEDSLAQDTAISAATGEQLLVDHGAWSAEEVDIMTTLPGVGYLYLATGAGADGGDDDYDAGIFLIELWGV